MTENWFSKKKSKLNERNRKKGVAETVDTAVFCWIEDTENCMQIKAQIVHTE